MSADGRGNDSGSDGAGTFGRSRASTPDSRSSFRRPSYEILKDLSPKLGPQPWPAPTPTQKGKQRQLDPSPPPPARSTVRSIERPRGPRERISDAQLDPRQHWAEGSASRRGQPEHQKGQRSASGQTFGDAEGDDSTSSIRSEGPVEDVLDAPRHPRSSTPPPVIGPDRSRSSSGTNDEGFGAGEGGGAAALARVSRSLTAVQLEEQRRLNQDSRQSGEIDREALARWRQTRAPAPAALGALAAATRGRPKSLIITGRPVSVPMRTSSSASSKEARRARSRPQSSSAQLGFPSHVDEGPMSTQLPSSDSAERNRTASEPEPISRAKLRANPRSVGPPLAPTKRSQALSFTPGVLPDGTLASTEIPRRNSSHKDRERWSVIGTGGEEATRPPSTPKANRRRSVSAQRKAKRQSPGSPTTSREEVTTMPAVAPLSPTPMPFRYGAGDWFNDAMSPDLSQVYSNRASLSTIWAAQARASARHHLAALTALQPRFPSRAAALRNLRTSSWLARVHHTTLLLVTYAHVLATLFLDYNTAYALAQLAVHPSVGPRGSGAAWWIAVGLYAAATALWLFGVVIVWEVVVQYSRRWSRTRPYIMPVYLSSPAFNLTALRSFSYYSLLYRVRWRAKPRDFAIETCWWLSQNWPTIITILPRGIIAAILTILYHPTATSRATSGQRDPIYFVAGGDALSDFAYGVVLANLAFMAWRVLVWLLSLAGLAILSDRSTPDSYDFVSPDVTLADRSSRALIAETSLARATDDLEADGLDRKSREALSLCGGWQSRAKERIRQALVEAMPAPGDHSAADLSERSFESSAADEEAHVEGYEMAERQDVSVAATSVFAETSTAASPAMEAVEIQPFVTSKPQGLAPRPTSAHKRREKRPRSESPPPVPPAAASTSSLVAPFAAAVGTPSPRRSPRPSPPGTAGAEREGRKPGWIVSEEPSPEPVVTAVPTHGGRSSTSLAESVLRSSGAQVSQEALDEEQAEELLDASERGKPSPKAEARTTWWSMLPGVRTKRVDEVAAATSVPESVDTARSSPTVTRPASRPGSRPTSSASKPATPAEAAAALLADNSLDDSGIAPAPPALRVTSPGGEDRTADDSVPSGLLRAGDESQDCSSSVSSDDSEERRLWASFPEQSRRHPPGLIALELEQRVLNQPTTQGLGIPLTPATAAAMAAVVTAVETLPSLAATSSAAVTTSTSTPAPAPRTSNDMPRSPSQGGLMAIREESWSSSLDSAPSEEGRAKKAPARRPL